ncbi:MAG TPA: amidohydrolase family protein [Pirellulales bacterium]|nr:amidohydrolase family protein [Pirellulales bacterium]
MSGREREASAGGQATSLFAPRMLDSVSGRMLSNVLVIISGDRIASVTENLPVPPKEGHPALVAAGASAPVVLPSSWTVLPGLIDGHTHLLMEPEDAVTTPLLHKSQAYRTVEAVAAVRRTLEAGFTAVRDVDSEGAGYADVAVRDAINRGVIPGPRMFVATNALTISGGYMNLLGYSPDLSLPNYGVMVDSPAAMIQAVRQNVKYGADLIKIYVTGSLPHVFEGFEPLVQMSEDEVKLVVDEAARWHRDVAAHAYGGKAVRNAILGGVRSIEHGILLDHSNVDLLVKHGVYFCPTLHVYSAEPGLERHGIEFMHQIRARHKQSFQMALQAGVKVVFGTDVGGYDHGQNAKEFIEMVGFGMSPVEAIRSATVRAAEMLRKEKDLGQVTSGRFADIIAVDGNPIEDIEAMLRVRFVMKGGSIFKHQQGVLRGGEIS